MPICLLIVLFGRTGPIYNRCTVVIRVFIIHAYNIEGVFVEQMPPSARGFRPQAFGLYALPSQGLVESCHGLRVDPDGTLPESPDLVVVPGGGWGEREQELSDALARLHDCGATLSSVCTGGVLLARAGLTDGRPAITHHEAVADLQALDAEVVDARVVDDGDLLTAGGVTAGIDLAIHVVEREFGPDVADRVRTEMEYEPRGEVYVA